MEKEKLEQEQKQEVSENNSSLSNNSIEEITKIIKDLTNQVNLLKSDNNNLYKMINDNLEKVVKNTEKEPEKINKRF